MQLNNYTFDNKRNGFAEFGALLNGGKGSGNFGHSGRPGAVGGSGTGSSTGTKADKFKEGEKVIYSPSGTTSEFDATILRKLSDKEKQDRDFLANPDAGDYYEIEFGPEGFRSKDIVWEAKLRSAKK